MSLFPNFGQSVERVTVTLREPLPDVVTVTVGAILDLFQRTDDSPPATVRIAEISEDRKTLVLEPKPPEPPAHQ